MNKQNALTFLVGLIFAIGLGISGMTQPGKVLGFLDVAGDWDPSLAFVMIGAIGVHAISYRLKNTKQKPLLAEEFSVPTTNAIDKPLLIGALLFGVGWGLGGFCPGPAIVSVVSLSSEVLLFCGGMVSGFICYKFIAR